MKRRKILSAEALSHVEIKPSPGTAATNGGRPAGDELAPHVRVPTIHVLAAHTCDAGTAGTAQPNARVRVLL